MLVNLSGGATSKVIGPAIQLFIVSQLSPSDYGLFLTSLALIYFYELVKDFGLLDSIIAQRAFGGINTLFSIQTVSAFAFALIIVTGSILALDFGWIGNTERNIIIIVCSSAFLMPFTDSIRTFYRLNGNYAPVAISNIIHGVATGAVGLYCIYLNLDAYALPIGFTAGHFVCAIYLRTGYPQKLTYQTSEFRTLFSLGKHVLAQRSSGFLVGHADTFIVRAALGPAVLGIYKLSQQIAYVIPNATIFFCNQVLFSELSTAATGKNFSYISRVYKLYCRFVGSAMLLLSILIVTVSQSMLPYALNSQWQDLATPLALISLGLPTGFMCLINNDLAKTLGFSNRYTALLTVRSLITVSVLLIFAKEGLETLIVAAVITGIVANIANETLFHCSQTSVRDIAGKLILYALSIAWFLITTMVII